MILFLLFGGFCAGRIAFDRRMRSGEDSRPARRLIIGLSVVFLAAGFTLSFSPSDTVVGVVSLSMSLILGLLLYRFAKTLPGR
jgi:hypothetical protein